MVQIATGYFPARFFFKRKIIMLQVTIWTQRVSFTVNPNFHWLQQIDTNVRKKCTAVVQQSVPPTPPPSPTASWSREKINSGKTISKPWTGH